MEIIVDTSYKTGLGTPFYDRMKELEVLDDLIRTYRLIIVYGPRNVGKSELIYYWCKNRARQQIIIFQVDLMRAGRIIEGLDRYLLIPEERIKSAILSELKKYTIERLGLLSLAYIIYNIAKTISNEIVLFLDEFHMLPIYRAAPYQSKYEEVLMDLEALAHRLAKDGGDRLKVVLTVSEGFVATGEAIYRLHGYNTSYMLVEQMDKEHYLSLYKDYKKRKGCSTEYRLIYGIAGGAPGYLAELCQGINAIVKFIDRSKTVLETSLSNVRNILSTEPWKNKIKDLTPQQLIRLAYEVMNEDSVKPIEKPLLYAIGQLLTSHNIVYPSYETGQVRFKPQIPLYNILLEIAVKKSVSSILKVEPAEVVDKIRKTVS